MKNHAPPKKISGLRCRILLLLLTDVVTSVSVVLFLLWLYRFIGFGRYLISDYLPLLPFAGVLIFCNIIFRCYHGNVFYPGAGLNKITEIEHLFYSVATTYFVLFAWLLFNRHAEIYSRIVLAFSMAVTIIVLPMARAIARRIMKFLKFGEINVLIAGAGKTGIAIAKELSANSYYGFRVVGFLDDDPEKQNRNISGIPVVGELTAAHNIAKEWSINYVICCLPVQVAMRTFQQYSAYFKHILFVPASTIFPISWLSPISIGVFSGFEVRNKLLQPVPRVLKFCLEVLMSFSAIIVLFPVFLVLALCVKLSSPGPIFYRSWRLGKNGKKIGVLKFRTMYADADAEHTRDGRILPEFTIENDIDKESLLQYRRMVSAHSPSHPWLVLEDKEFLIKLGGYRIDKREQKEGLTIAGLLMFGKYDSITDMYCCPNYFPDYREYLSPDMNSRWSNRVYYDGTWEANLFQFYIKVYNKLSAALPKPFALRNGQRIDDTPTRVALREAFINALIHSDYSINASLNIEQHKDFLKFSNPGSLLITIAQYYQGGESVCRNKYLQQMFMLLGAAEKAGSGADKILQGWKEANYRSPKLEESVQPNKVILTMPLVNLLSEDILSFLKENYGNKFNDLSHDELITLATCYSDIITIL